MRDPGFNTRTSVATPADAERPVSPPWDDLADPTVETLFPSGITLWPRGAAWGTPDGTQPDANSNLSGLMRALLAPFAVLYRRAFLLARESSPALLDQTLAEWEVEYDLPGPCVVGEQTRAERLIALAAKVNAAPLVTPGDFVRFSAEHGFTVEIEEPAVFECGFSECGGEHATGAAYQEVYWIVRVEDLAISFFTTGESETGFDPLFSFNDANELLCLLLLVSPAWTIPVLDLPA